MTATSPPKDKSIVLEELKQFNKDFAVKVMCGAQSPWSLYDCVGGGGS